MIFIIGVLDEINRRIRLRPFYLGLIFLAIYVFLRFSIGGIYVESHDNLDGAFVNWSLLYNQNISYFNPLSKLPNIANGALVGNVFPTVNIGEFLFMLFKPITAYALNELIVKFSAFVGMLLLLKKYFSHNNDKISIAFWVAVSFSLLPFNPTPFLTISGQPLLLFAFLNILNNEKRLYNWLIFLVFPFYSSLALAGFAICALFGLILIFFSWKQKKIHVPGLVSLVLLSSMYLISTYKLIYLYFIDGNFVSIRSLWPTHDILSMSAMIKSLLGNFANNSYESLSIFLFGQEHAPSLHTYFILGSILIAIGYSRVKKTEKSKIIKIIATCLIISIFYGFWLDIVRVIPVDSMFIKSFRWTRIHWLHPMLWYVVFFISLSVIYDSKSAFTRKISVKAYQYMFILVSFLLIFIYSVYIDRVVEKYTLVYPDIVSMLRVIPISFSIFFIALTLYVGLFKDSIVKKIKTSKSIYNLLTMPRMLIIFILLSGQIIYNLNPIKIGKIFVYDEIKASHHHGGLRNTTFDDYFLKDTFENIDKYINIPKENYRVISIGLSPSVALYNGFYTLDMYLPTYSASYKTSFREIIKKELKKNTEIREYFDNTGKRCYIFVDNLGKRWDYRKHELPSSISIELDIGHFKSMGGRYILSSVEIENDDKNSLLFHKLFASNDSKKLDIFLYEAR